MWEIDETASSKLRYDETASSKLRYDETASSKLRYDETASSKLRYKSDANCHKIDFREIESEIRELLNTIRAVALLPNSPKGL